MTDAEFQSWLETDNRRTVVLMEVALDTPLRLSNVPFTSLPTDNPPNQFYTACISGGLALSENLSLDGNPTISVGDIEIDNMDGAFDEWLTYVWVNRGIKVWIGDLTWPLAQFRLIFSGVCSDLGSRNANTLNIGLRNKLEKLNTPVSEQKLGGTSANKDRYLPLLFGEVHNLTPLLTDEAAEEFQFHTGAAERLIEARSNGAPLTVTTNLPAGKFNMTTSVYGTITCSAQGGVPYTNTIAGIIKRLATNYGTPSERFNEEDIDTVNFASFDGAHPDPVGIFIGDRTNVLAIIQELAASIGAQVVTSNTGLLRLYQINLPAAGTPFEITPTDYVQGSLGIKERTEVRSGVLLGYCRNWTVQSDLETGIPAAHKDLFAQEYLTVSAKDAAVATQYRLYAEPEQVNTHLQTEASANAEAQRRLNLWKVPHTVYSVVGYANLMLLELGQTVRLTAPRWELTAGKTGIVVGLQRDWIKGRVTVELLI